MIEVEQSADLVQATHNAAQMIERIARVCYNSEHRMACDCADGECRKCQERRNRFLGSLKDKHHDSVFEHASATFKLVTDRGITHELVRHRIASFTQSSTRYIRFDGGIPVIRPLGMGAAEESEWKRAMLAAEEAYQKLLASGVQQQNARDVLPTCTAATLFVTANFREWRHILALRLASGAHPKIRQLARLVWDKIMPLCTVYFDDLTSLIKGDA